MYSHDPQTITSNLRMGFSAGARQLANSTAEEGSVPDDFNLNRSFFLLTAIVGFVCTVYLLCTLHLLEYWWAYYCCKSDGAVPASTETVLAHENRIFNLTSNQRRAVLEVIYAESSRAVVDSDVPKTTKKRPIPAKDEDYEASDIPNDEEVPGVSTVSTEDDNSSNADINTDVVATATNLIDLSTPIPQCRRESWAMTTSECSYDDDSTGDNVCAICLCGYMVGEMLIVSKYCTHAFHKDCILEWLEKQDDCPICRVDMVTDSEMRQAARVLIGKMRMYKAVASYTTASTQRLPSASPSYRANQLSPLHGTVRRCAETRRHYLS